MDATFERLYKSAHVKISGKVCEASIICLSSLMFGLRGPFSLWIIPIAGYSIFFWIRKDPWWQDCYLQPEVEEPPDPLQTTEVSKTTAVPFCLATLSFCSCLPTDAMYVRSLWIWGERWNPLNDNI